jgi:hypothetical protein
MTENREIFTRLVAEGLSNQEVAEAMSREIGDVVSVPQVARFKREFGLIKSSEKPPELVIQKIPRDTKSLEKMLKLMFSKQFDVLEQCSVSITLESKLFKVRGDCIALDALNALYLEKQEELKKQGEKEQAIAKLKALGVSSDELLKLLEN